MPALFFDFDGTLFDTRADLAATVNHTRRDLGLSEISSERVLSFVGHGANYLLAHAIPERTDESVRTIFKRHYAEHCCDLLQPYPGVIETLEELRRRGYRFGVNTNKPSFAVKAILEKFNMMDFFGDAVVAGGEGAPLKPDPASVRACASRMGHTLTPQDWMIGDSHIDLECARAAGVKSAFCAFGFGSLAGAPYMVRLNSFADLLSVV